MKVVPSLIAIAALCGVSGVQAEELPSAQVQYADLNLQNPAGVQALYARLGIAAAQVCESYSASAKELARSRAYKACIVEAVARAVAQINHIELNRYADEGTSARARSRLARR